MTPNEEFHIPVQTYPYLLSAAQIRVCEEYTLRQKHISSLDLMEQAGIACCRQLCTIATELNRNKFVIFCGNGNNGGDGLAIARLLVQKGYTVKVILCQDPSSHCSPNRQYNLEQWQKILLTFPENECIEYDENSPFDIPTDSILVDALFGIGLNKDISGIFKSAIMQMNRSDAFTVAIDVPSGLFIDQHTNVKNPIVTAHCTFTMQFNKLAFLLPENYPFCGEIFVMDIGILPAEGLSVTRECLLDNSVRMLYRTPYPYANKGTFGHGLLIAGSAAMPGAAILAASAAMRGGIGKLTVHSAKQVVHYLPYVLPEAILHPDFDDCIVSNIDWSTLQKSINAIAIGPGIGTDKRTVNLVKDVLHSIQDPVILDADTLNILADNKTWLAYLPGNSILTPHFKEFERLVGPADNDFDRIEKAKDFAQRYSVIIILKGYHTVISMPNGQQFINMTGNPGMATAGSGDTLTGLLLALLAQGYTPESTALIGVYLHGLAGDLAAAELSPQCMTASDISLFFGHAFQTISSKTDLY